MKNHREFVNTHTGAFKTASKIDELIKPLREYFNISYFQYDKAYLDGRRVVVTSRDDWLQHCLDNKYYEISYFESDSCRDGSSKHVFWENVNEQSEPVFNAAYQFYDIADGFSIIVNSGAYTEFFHFACAKEETSLRELCAKHMDLFHRFILYFKDQAKNIIDDLEKYPIIYPNTNIYDTSPIHQGISNGSGRHREEQSRFYVFDESGPYLTSSEYKCLQMTLEKGSIDLGASELNITARTAYAHINNVKIKLDCRTLFQLGELIASSSLKDVIS